MTVAQAMGEDPSLNLPMKLLKSNGLVHALELVDVAERHVRHFSFYTRCGLIMKFNRWRNDRRTNLPVNCLGCLACAST